MRRAWKLYDKCYQEISAIGGPFLNWAPQLRPNQENGASSSSLDDTDETTLPEVSVITLIDTI